MHRTWRTLKLVWVAMRAIFVYYTYGPPRKSWSLGYYLNAKLVQNALDLGSEQNKLKLLYAIRERVEGMALDQRAFAKKFPLVKLETMHIRRRDSVLAKVVTTSQHFRGHRMPHGGGGGGGDGHLECELQYVPDTDAQQQRVILYFHGGAHVLLSAKSHRLISAKLAETTKHRVLSVEYRLAPEHPFPAGLFDAVAAYIHLLEIGYLPQDISVMGDSAGGHLGLTLMLFLKEFGRDLAQVFQLATDTMMPGSAVFFSPWADLTMSLPSVRLNDCVDYLNDPRRVGQPGINPAYMYYDGMESLAYLGNVEQQALIDERMSVNPYFCPALCGDFHGMSPTLIQCGSVEILLSDALAILYRSLPAPQSTFNAWIADVTEHVMRKHFDTETHRLTVDKHVSVLAEQRANEEDEQAALIDTATQHLALDVGATNVTVQIYEDQVHAFQAFPIGDQHAWALDEARSFLQQHESFMPGVYRLSMEPVTKRRSQLKLHNHARKKHH